MAGQRTRAVRAAVGIVLAIAAIAASGTVCGWAAGADAASKALHLSEVGVESRSSGASPEDWLGGELADGQLVGDSPSVSLAGEATGLEAVPQWFAQELFPLDGMRDIRVSADGGVIGFVASSDEEAALDRFRAELQQGGWVESETGVEECSVFMKGGGTCRWAMVSCIPAGDATSVVVRCVVDQGKP